MIDSTISLEFTPGATASIAGGSLGAAAGAAIDTAIDAAKSGITVALQETGASRSF